MEWKPIESAPRDGRWFLGAVKSRYDVLGESEWWMGTVRFDLPDDTGPELMRPDGYEVTEVYLTHWMPLPEPPIDTPSVEGE